MLKNPPPLRKTASKLSIYINFKTLILPEWAIMCSFCCISSCKEKIPEILSSQKYFAGGCWFIRQIDSTLAIAVGFLHRDGSIQNRTTLRLISIFATTP